MRQLGLKPSDTELEDLMNEIDTDRSGTISFEGTPRPITALVRFPRVILLRLLSPTSPLPAFL